MIFVTVGTQLPFDRMIRTVDRWAAECGRDDVFAQIGPGAYEPRNLGYSRFIGADEFRERVQRAQVVIAHAGMGSIITALELGKPIIVMPRLVELGEHRNDHQVATARRFLAQGRIIVAFDAVHLVEKLNTMRRMIGSHPISKEASPRLMDAIRQFIHGRESSPALSGDVQLVEESRASYAPDEAPAEAALYQTTSAA
jgi:UDP-N-acetylglucosamine transferase subunit ALG13